MTVVGTAEVVAHAVTAGFAAEFERGTAPAFKAVEAQAEAAGVRSGEALAAGTSKATAANTRAFGGLAAAGHKAFLGLGVATAAAVAESIHLAAGMQKTDAAISAVTHTSTEAGKAIGDAMLKAGTENTFGGKELAGAYALVAGQLQAVHGKALDTAQALEVMKSASALAEAKQIDLGSATKVLSSTMQSFGLDSEHAAHVSDVLFAASNATGTSVETLGMQLSKMHSKMGDTAGSLSQMSGLLVDMTNHGVTGRSAMIGLTSGLTNLNKTSVNLQKATDAQNQSLSAMSPKLQALARGYENGTVSSKALKEATSTLSPSQQALVKNFTSATSAVQKAQEAYKNLGVQAFDSKGKFVGMGSVIDQLEPKFKHMTQQQQLAAATTIFGAGAARQMTAVINAGSAAYDKSTEMVAKHGQAETAAQKQAQTLHGQIETLKNTLESLATTIGEALIPTFTTMAHVVLTTSQYVLNHKAVLIAVAAVVTGVLGTALAVFAVNKMAAFGASFVKAGRTLGIFAAETEVTATAVEGEMVGMEVAAVESAAGIDVAMGATGVGAILIGVGIAATLLLTHWKQVTHAISTAAKEVLDFIKAHWELLATIMLGPLGAIAAGYHHFQGMINGIFSSIVSFVNNAWNKITSGASDAVGGVTRFFAGLPGKIGRVLASLPGSMLHFGENIVQGLINGIENKVGDLVHSVEGLAGKITGKIGHLLGIGSPSRVMHQFGVWTVQGFQEGFDAQSATVHMQTPVGKITYNASAARSSGGGGSVAQQIMSFFTGKGLSGAQSAGIVGNLKQESGLNPASPGGYLAQWGGARLSGLQAFAKQQGTAVTNLDTQLKYIWKELTGSEKGALKGLRGAHSPADAARAFSNLYERPGIPAMSNRVRYAEEAFGGLSHKSSGGGASGSIGSGGDKKSLVQQKAALDKWVRDQRIQLDNKTHAEQQAVSKGTAAEKEKVRQEIVQQRAALATEIAAKKAALGDATKAEKKEAAQQTKDKKSASTDLNNMLKAIHSGSLTSLNTVLDKAHNTALKQLEVRLSHDHSSALSALSKQLVKVHKDALAAQKTAQDKVNAQAAAEAATAADQANAANISNATKIQQDQANAVVQGIQDQTRIALDLQAEAGKTGEDLVAAHAQTVLDQMHAENDQRLAADQVAVDQAANGGSATQQALAAQKLATDQSNAAIAEAQQQSVLDLASAAATVADAAAQAATAVKDDTSTSTVDTSGGVQPIFYFTINGGGMTASELMSEVGWALKTGQLPPAAPMSVVPTPALATGGKKV